MFPRGYILDAKKDVQTFNIMNSEYEDPSYLIKIDNHFKKIGHYSKDLRKAVQILERSNIFSR